MATSTTTTTQTLKQRTNTPAPKPADDLEREELISRGLLNSTYPLLKKVVAEHAVISIAGLTAVLLQIAHPGVGIGVGNHSNFSYRFIERSENTAMYIYTMVFGSEEEKKRMKGFVDGRHGGVNDRKRRAREGGDGKASYDALDPELQLWVAITLYATYVPVYESIFGAFTPAQSAQVLQEFSLLGTSLQVPLALWPRSLDALDTYFNNIVTTVLRMTPQCARTTAALRNPVKSVPWYYKPLVTVTGPLHWNASTERLPARAREVFGLESTAWTKGVDAVGMMLVRYTYPWYPEWVRTWPQRYYLGLARRELAVGGRLNGKR